MFKMTDCPRNVVNSAIPPDKEDLINIFVQKMLHRFHFPFSVQDNKKKLKLKDNISCLSCFPFQLKPEGLPSLPGGKKKTEDQRDTTSMAFRSDLPRTEKLSE